MTKAVCKPLLAWPLRWLKWLRWHNVRAACIQEVRETEAHKALRITYAESCEEDVLEQEELEEITRMGHMAVMPQALNNFA